MIWIGDKLAQQKMKVFFDALIAGPLSNDEKKVKAHDSLFVAR